MVAYDTHNYTLSVTFIFIYARYFLLLPTPYDDNCQSVCKKQPLCVLSCGTTLTANWKHWQNIELYYKSHDDGS